jgi:hypothetical protein
MREAPLRKLLRLLAELGPREVIAIYGFARGLHSAGSHEGASAFLPGHVRPAGVSPALVGGPDYLIRQESTRRRVGTHDRTLVSTWRIRFRREDFLMPAWVGTEHVVFLMRNQPKEFDAGALTQAIRKSMAVGDSASGETAREVLYGPEGHGDGDEPVGGRVGDLNERDVIWDGGQIAGCERKIKGLEAELRLHEKAGDFTSDAYQAFKRNLEEQQELLMANAKQVKGEWVPKAYQQGTFEEKADRIRKHVRKLLDECLRDNCRPLFDHLNDRNTLVYGVKNCYHPKPPVPWRFELKGD